LVRTFHFLLFSPSLLWTFLSSSIWAAPGTTGAEATASILFLSSSVSQNPAISPDHQTATMMTPPTTQPAVASGSTVRWLSQTHSGRSSDVFGLGARKERTLEGERGKEERGRTKRVKRRSGILRPSREIYRLRGKWAIRGGSSSFRATRVFFVGNAGGFEASETTLAWRFLSIGRVWEIL
jgi:hypothetical protein